MRERPAAPLIRRICHDLTQPLTALQGYIELALHFNQSAEEMRQSLVDAGEEAERMAELLRSVRAFADAMTPSATLQPVRLQTLISTAIEEIPHRGKGESAAVFAELDEQEYLVQADRERLKTAFQQILDFSLAHAAAPLAVSFESVDGSGQMTIIGRNSRLTEMDCEALFDPSFRQPAGRRVYSAERFRLAAAALIIQQAGGAVRAQPGTAAGQLLVKITFARPEA